MDKKTSYAEDDELRAVLKELEELGIDEEEAEEVLETTACNYNHTIGEYKLLTADEEKDLARKRDRGDPEALDTLILSNLRLVYREANTFFCPHMEYEDLVQEGTIGLMNAAQKFDPERDIRFSTYAVYWIRQAIGRAIANTGRMIRVPVCASEKIAKIRRAKSRLEEEEREISIENISELSDLTKKEVRSYLHKDRDVFSLDYIYGSCEDGDEITFLDFLEDTSYKVDRDLEERDRREKLMQVLSSLPPRDMEVLVLRYGLNGSPRHTLKEISDKIGIHKERVRQIESQALEKLQDPCRLEILSDYFPFFTRIDKGKNR